MTIGRSVLFGACFSALGPGWCEGSKETGNKRIVEKDQKKKKSNSNKGEGIVLNGCRKCLVDQ